MCSEYTTSGDFHPSVSRGRYSEKAQVSGAAESMQDQADKLAQVVSVFNIEGSHAFSRAPAEVANSAVRIPPKMVASVTAIAQNPKGPMTKVPAI